MLPNNTSQDPDYYGPTGHEKKFHKTHFPISRKLKLRTVKDNGYVWVYMNGRQARIKKDIALQEGYEIVKDKRHNLVSEY